MAPKSGNPPHICHLTVLNPALHSRIFHKEARSQYDAGYQVSIVGQDAATDPYLRDGIRIVPTGIFSRLQTARFLARKNILKLALAEDADIYQVHTPELLAVARKIKKNRPNTKIIYDVHEDYKLNILHAAYYPPLIRKVLSQKVIKAEQEFANYGDGLIYAENCFKDISALQEDRIAYVTNRFHRPEGNSDPLELAEINLPLMLYTGTISENWGIMRTLKLWELLNRKSPVNLLVAGHTQDKRLLHKIRKQVEKSGLDYRFSMFKGADYVPYEHIINLIEQCSFGVALYQLRENIRDRIPTKFYEFMACRKPLIYTDNPAWNTLNEKLDFGMKMSWPPETRQVDEISAMLRNMQERFYKNPISEKDYAWEPEAKKMLALIERILA